VSRRIVTIGLGLARGAVATRKRLFLTVVVVGVLGFLGIRAWQDWDRPPRINEETYAKIHRELSQKEVIALVGAPPGSFFAFGNTPAWQLEHRWEQLVDNRTYTASFVSGKRSMCRWADEHHELTVFFGADGKAIGKKFRNAEPETWHDYLLAKIASVLRSLGVRF
jgi:hypothetical protein